MKNIFPYDINLPKNVPKPRVKYININSFVGFNMVEIILLGDLIF